MRNIELLFGLLLVVAACGNKKEVKACLKACEKAALDAHKACGPYPEKGTDAEQQAQYDCTRKTSEASASCVAACDAKAK